MPMFEIASSLKARGSTDHLSTVFESVYSNCNLD